MVDAAAAGLDGLDVLVNNAGIYIDHPVLGTSYEQWQAAWQATLGVNLVGAANVTWCAVRHMVAGGSVPGHGAGRIVNVGSRGAFRGEPIASGVRGEQGGAARVRPVARRGARAARDHRGLGRPRIHRDRHDLGELATPAGDVLRAQSPFGRVATADEVAAAVLYLASPEAEWASGAVLDLNGASYLR